VPNPAISLVASLKPLFISLTTSLLTLDGVRSVNEGPGVIIGWGTTATCIGASAGAARAIGRSAKRTWGRGKAMMKVWLGCWQFRCLADQTLVLPLLDFEIRRFNTEKNLKKSKKNKTKEEQARLI
jgi:hypothetical protein